MLPSGTTAVFLTMQQLKLFPQPTPTPQYKAGDWIKTKRKPAVAAWIKRGEVFRVNAVHPINGSIQFWNPHINQWDFLYPEEVKPYPTPITAESVVEQITAESVVEQKNYYNSDNGYSGNGFLESHYKIRIGGRQKSINCPEIGCTGPYNSYRWREEKKQRAKYVPASKCPAVRRALAIGQPVSEILKIISKQ